MYLSGDEYFSRNKSIFVSLDDSCVDKNASFLIDNLKNKPKLYFTVSIYLKYGQYLPIKSIETVSRVDSL